MEEYLHLPAGHLLNLQRRAPHSEHTRLNIKRLERTQDKDDETISNMTMDSNDTQSPSGTSLRRARRPTKLPVPRGSAEKDQEKGKGNPSTPEYKDYTMTRNDRPRDSSVTPDGGSPTPMDKDREQYWRKVREKFDKGSPAPSRSKDKQKDHQQGGYRKIISLASSTRNELAKHKLRDAGGAAQDSPQTRIASPSNTRHSLRYNSRREIGGYSTAQRILQIKGDQSTNSDIDENSLQRSDSSNNSYPSMSPVSGPGSSLTEWEDRFVVNMPSAREPNPPTMTDRQITQFQQSIEKVHKEGESMLDPETLPSPRTTTPEEKVTPEQPDKKLNTFDGQDSRSAPPVEADEHSPTSLARRRRYYSPDEVGKHRFSTIWEESPSKPKKNVPEVNLDGSFLGCKEINGPNDKNPDEILLFSPADEHPILVDVSCPTPTTPQESTNLMVHQVKPKLEEKNVVQEEWKPISLNLKHAQCSKQLPRAMCHETSCRQLEKLEMPLKALTSTKENLDSPGSWTSHYEKRKATLQDDDVFIITPTITRTMVTMTDLKSYSQKHPSIQTPISRTAGEIITTRAKPQIKPSPSGLRRAMQTSQEKSKVPCTPPSKNTTIRNILVIKDRTEPGHPKVEKTRDTHGYIHTPGMVKSSTENLSKYTRSNLQQSLNQGSLSNTENAIPTRSISDSPQFTRSLPLPDVSPVESFFRHQREDKATVDVKVVEVAELDGSQVHNLKETRHSKTRDLSVKLPNTDVDADTQGPMKSMTLALIIETFVLSAGQVQTLYNRVMTNRHSKAALLKISLHSILQMVEHCLEVLRNFLAVFSTYSLTGTWPRPNKEDLARSLTDLCQAVACMVTLGFIMMIIERAAGYIVLIGSWIVWIIKPLGWAFGTFGRAIIP